MTSVKKIIIVLITICFYGIKFTYAQPTVFENKGIGGGGATFQPSISPHNDGLYFITSDMSHILRSDDAGNSFGQIPFDELQGTGQHSKVEFTSDPNILYSFGYTGYPAPNEPMKSTDGGQTWSALSGDPTNGGVLQLFADPTTTDRIVLCSYSQVYISIDGGVSFSNIYAPGVDVYLGGVFWDGDDVYIAVNGSTPSGSSPELLVSNDGGVTFTAESVNGDFTSGQYFRYMEGVKDNGQVKLFAVTMHSTFGGLLFSEWWGPQRKVLRLNYGSGNTWESISGPATGLTLVNDGGSFHPNIIATCSSAPETIYVGGFDAPAMEVYRSVDSGNSWTKVLDCENDNQNAGMNTGWIGAGGAFNWWWAGSVLGMDVANSNPDVVVITDFVSAHHTRDGGATWNALYVPPSNLNPMNNNTPTNNTYSSNGFEITTSWDMHWATANDVFAAYSDVQGFLSNDGGDTWGTDYNYPTFYNTTYSITPSPDGSKLYACVSDKHDMYGSIYLTDALIDDGTGEIFESSDNGLNWSVTHDFQRVVMDMAIDPDNPNRFYACIANSIDGGIYYSDDSGSTWSLLSTPPRTEGHPIEIEVLGEDTLVAVFSARYHNSQFTASSGIFLSTDNGATWSDRSDTGMQYWTMDVEIAPDNNQLWYASVRSHWGPNNSQQGGVYRSTDQGLSWIRIKDFYRVQSITLHPLNSDVAYICTHDNFEGLQYSENISSSNPVFTPVTEYLFDRPNRVKINPFNTDEIWVTSLGNGLKKGVASDPVNVVFAEANYSKSNYVQIYPNPVRYGTEGITIGFHAEISGPIRVKIIDPLGRVVQSTAIISQHSKNEHFLKLDGLSPGLYKIVVDEKASGLLLIQ